MYRFHLLRIFVCAAALSVCAAAQTTEGPRTFSGSNSTEIVNVQQGGSGFGLQATTPSTGPIGAVFGEASGTSGFTNGVWGRSFSTAGVGVRGEAMATSGPATGVAGFSSSFSGIGVFGHAAGDGMGVVGKIDSEDDVGVGVMGIATNGRSVCCNIPGVFEQQSGAGVIIVGQFLDANNQVHRAFEVGGGGTSAPLFIASQGSNTPAGSNLFIGQDNNFANVFRVDSKGAVFANGGFFPAGADFAESLPVKGMQADYAPGDVLVIDDNSQNRLTRTAQPYSTLVAGIYSTKPGILGGSGMEKGTKTDVPLAVVGIVPCKVTSANGAIKTGDLLVTSDKAGYAMKGTDRSRMIGAVVGKALEPLSKGEATIRVLVTLQ